MRYLDFLTSPTHEELSAANEKLLVFPRTELKTLN